MFSLAYEQVICLLTLVILEDPSPPNKTLAILESLPQKYFGYSAIFSGLVQTIVTTVYHRKKTNGRHNH